jgi:hypothetical protein
MNTLMVLAQQGNGGGFAGAIGALVWLAIVGLVLASMWTVFAKAGQPGWGVLVPIFNIYLLTKIANRPAWWTVLFFVPFVNFIMFAVISIDVAKAFGKGVGFGIGLWLFGVVFYPILAFGSAEYQPSGQDTFDASSSNDRAMAA